MGRAPICEKRFFKLSWERKTPRMPAFFSCSSVSPFPHDLGSMLNILARGFWHSRSKQKLLWVLIPHEFSCSVNGFPFSWFSCLLVISWMRMPRIQFVFLNWMTNKRFRFDNCSSQSGSGNAQKFVIVVYVCIPWLLLHFVNPRTEIVVCTSSFEIWIDLGNGNGVYTCLINLVYEGTSQTNLEGWFSSLHNLNRTRREGMDWGTV